MYFYSIILIFLTFLFFNPEQKYVSGDNAIVKAMCIIIRKNKFLSDMKEGIYEMYPILVRLFSDHADTAVFVWLSTIFLRKLSLTDMAISAMTIFVSRCVFDKLRHDSVSKKTVINDRLLIVVTSLLYFDSELFLTALRMRNPIHVIETDKPVAEELVNRLLLLNIAILYLRGLDVLGLLIMIMGVLLLLSFGVRYKTRIMKNLYSKFEI